jgi:hypothetical protein
MKIVGFNTNEGLRLGVVEGEVVIDLRAVVPSDFGECWTFLRPIVEGLSNQEELRVRQADGAAMINAAQRPWHLNRRHSLQTVGATVALATAASGLTEIAP